MNHMKRSVKKGIVFLLALIAATGNAQSLFDNQDLESLSYALGVSQTQGLTEYLVDKLDVDTMYMGAFAKGVRDAALSSNDKEKAAYFAGLQIGQQIGEQVIMNINKELFGESPSLSINKKAFLDGFVFGINADTDAITKATQIVQEKMRLIKADSLLEEFADNKLAGENYLREMAKKEGIRFLSNGVLYKVIEDGHGSIPKEDSTVKVHYEGMLIDGTTFDSSFNGSPVTLAVNQVIPGLTEVLTHMPVGAIWEVYIPQELAYAERMQGEIKPFSALIFKVELLAIEK